MLVQAATLSVQFCQDISLVLALRTGVSAVQDAAAYVSLYYCKLNWLGSVCVADHLCTIVHSRGTTKILS